MLAGGSTRAARVPALGSSSREPAAGPAAPPAATTPPRPVPADAIVLSRGDVDHALGDFASLAAAIHGSFSASGLMVDSVGEDSIFRRAGVRAGDVIASVDGAKLQSLDDAANVYARAPTANALTVQIVRDGKPITLHVVIR
jgi:S1-C subfamily serine protease